MSINVEDIDPNIESTGDKLHRVVRAGLGLLPIGSGTAVEIFNGLVTAPLEKRRVEWMVSVTEALQRLETQISLTSIFESEEFLSTLIAASAEALKTHEKEKIKALKAVVVNSAIGEAPEFSKRALFIRYISEFTVWHLKILILFNNPKKWAKENNIVIPNQSMGSRSNLLVLMYPELSSESDFYELIWNDLYTRGLLEVASPVAMMTGSGVVEPCTTESGRNFVEFIDESNE